MADEMPIVGPCASCDMRCCLHFSVPLTAFDIARICRKLECKPEEFCGLVDAENVEQAPHANIFVFDENGKLAEKALVLRKNEKEACVFFRGREGCAVHGFHPMPCKAYPFVFDENGKVKLNRHFLCPRKWKTSEYDENETVGLLDKIEEEFAFHDTLVRAWNANEAKKYPGKKSEAEFLAYLVEAADKLDGI